MSELDDGWYARAVRQHCDAVVDGRGPTTVRMSQATYDALLRKLEAKGQGNNYAAVRVYKVFLGMSIELGDTEEFGALEMCDVERGG